jgi:hypothetical protein
MTTQGPAFRREPYTALAAKMIGQSCSRIFSDLCRPGAIGSSGTGKET